MELMLGVVIALAVFSLTIWLSDRSDPTRQEISLMGGVLVDAFLLLMLGKLLPFQALATGVWAPDELIIVILMASAIIGTMIWASVKDIDVGDVRILKVLLVSFTIIVGVLGAYAIFLSTFMLPVYLPFWQ